MKRKCKQCKRFKLLDKFSKNPSCREGRSHICKKCDNIRARARYNKRNERDKNLRRLYGIGLKDYDNMLRQQGGRCAICKKQANKLVVDHDHKTLKVRGLLCGNCNRALGIFDDNINVLKAAILYLI